MSALAKNYNRRKIAFERGKGSFLYSTSGKKYLDFVQGIAVNSLGHSNPYLIKAMNKQSKKVWHVSNAFLIPEGERLAKRLTQKTFADYVFFQKVSALNPFFHIINIFRYGFLGVSDGPLLFGLIYLPILALLGWFIAFFLFKKGYKIKS